MEDELRTTVNEENPGTPPLPIPETQPPAVAGPSGRCADRKWWLMQVVFLALMVILFNTMWTQMGRKLEDVKGAIRQYEQSMEALNKGVAELQQQVVFTVDAGTRHENALRASLQSQRNALQEQLRVLQQQLQELDAQEAQLSRASQ